ncbi:MAG: Ubiquitin fusion degradation protein 4 [Pleopsidium flavum]|nr:MAG: Ubiquitin fusion degradation protein 4 [Pleopsidium flavum]
MSSRVTRSSARRAADSTASASQPPTTTTPQPVQPTRKRKTAVAREPSPDNTPEPVQVSPPRRAKRQRVSNPEPTPQPAAPSRRKKGKPPTAMSNLGQSSNPSNETPNPVPASNSTSKRKSSRNKRSDPSASTPASSSRRTKKSSTKQDEDVAMKDAEDNQGRRSAAGRVSRLDGAPGGESDGDGHPRDYDDEDDEDDEDPFRGGYLGGPGGPPAGLSSTLRALSGMMSGVSTRLRDILNNLKQKDDPSVQLIALQELSEILLVSTEDNLSGHFSPDQFVKELVALMQPSQSGDENPEMMLLACRCIANLMEALPASTANVVYGGAVPILCQKLLEIHFIDLAEQALSTLEKISVEFPASIVREGGLTACLTYLDFFATSTQRTAVTTAANCCRNIPEDSFPVIRDVMPILLNVLSSSDQKVVEQGSLCVSRVVESFKYQQDKLEELVSTDMLKAILRLLLPGTTNLIGPSIHTQFLRVLAITARASPRLATELFKMNVVDTLYQILTGVSPPSGTEDVSSKIDTVVIMQALIHRPREQVFETLNVICELLPGIPSHGLSYLDDLFETGYPGDNSISLPPSRARKSPNEKRIELLRGCQEELKRFAMILLPTLTDAYSSTVNLNVRQKVLTAQLKMLSNLDTTILEDSLCTVPYASYLASILSQQDHPTLVTFALQAAELLLQRLGSIYRYQFYREGVIAEIAKLASQPPQKTGDTAKAIKIEPEAETASLPSRRSAVHIAEHDAKETLDEKQNEDDPSDEDNEDDEDHDDHDEILDDVSASPSSSSSSERNYSVPPVASNVRDYVTLRAKKFLDTHENASGKGMREKASKILHGLQELAKDIESCYLEEGSNNGVDLFNRLAKYFDGDALESITSFELLNSEIVRVLLDVFNNDDGKVICVKCKNESLTAVISESTRNEARTAFLEVFMGTSVLKKAKLSSGISPTTPFSVLVHKLQDLLSRAEHFEVITVHHNAFDSNRSSAASMLAKQIRLKLVADDHSEIPRPYRNIMVSIHAIATFKALDDYLRPRISLSERPRGVRHPEGVSNALAAIAAAAGLPNPHQRLLERGLLGTGEPPPIPSHPSVGSNGRAARKSSKTKAPSVIPAPQSSSSNTKDKTGTTRRSSRRQQSQSQAPPPPPAQDTEELRHPLECPDEQQLTDDDDHLDESSALDAIVDDLEDGMDGETLPDPTAVNLEVASTGKVTARKEDGTRVATPSQSSTSVSRILPSVQTGAPAAANGTATLTSRPMSYAAAIQAVPQDWHIEFSIGDRPIANETTIYRAVHYNRTQPDEPTGRNLWSAIHSIKFKRVSGPPTSEPSTLTPPPEVAAQTTSSGMPMSLDKNPTTSAILRLLNIMHELNANPDDVLAENKDTVKLNAEPLSQFVNTKLTAKLNRQMEEPLIVASNCLPSWSEDLARLYPFLFPFETRHLFLQSTSFGYSRSMSRWQHAQSTEDSRHRHRDDRPFLGRLQRQKVRISRTRILESGVKVMELYGASPSVLEVEYFEEVGTGLGPTLEFYSTVSKEFSKKKLKLWRENEANDDDEYAFGKLGLFPAPMSVDQADHENGKRVLHLFKMLGKFVARSMIDSRIIDVSFNPTFFRIGDGPSTVTPSLGAVKTVDNDLAKSLKLVKQFAYVKKRIDENGRLSAVQKVHAAHSIEIQGVQVEDLGLDFTLPGYPAIELVPNGSNISVTIDNVGSYVEKVIDLTLSSGVQRQVEAFRTGFSQVFPYSALRAFTPNELVMLFGRVEEDWTLATLMDSIKADHGFNMDSKSVRNLLQTMSELSLPQRRDFLQFVTGSPKLPIGGFKSLTPMFTVVCKPSEPPYTSDDYLPSVMTCVNYLKLPDYTDLNVMRERLNTAIREGQGAFHLS